MNGSLRPTLAVSALALALCLAGPPLARADEPDGTAYVCISDRMVGVGPLVKAEMRTVDDLRDRTRNRRRYAKPLQPAHREFIVVVRPARLEAPFARDIEAACAAGGPDARAFCLGLPRWVLQIPDAKLAAPDRGRGALIASSDAVFHGTASVFALSDGGLFTLARLEGEDGSSVEEGRCSSDGAE